MKPHLVSWWYKHAILDNIRLHNDLIDAALDQIWLRWNHLRLENRIADSLEVLDLFQLLELTE